MEERSCEMMVCQNKSKSECRETENIVAKQCQGFESGTCHPRVSSATVFSCTGIGIA